MEEKASSCQAFPTSPLLAASSGSAPYLAKATSCWRAGHPGHYSIFEMRHYLHPTPLDSTLIASSLFASPPLTLFYLSSLGMAGQVNRMFWNLARGIRQRSGCSYLKKASEDSSGIGQLKHKILGTSFSGRGRPLQERTGEKKAAPEETASILLPLGWDVLSNSKGEKLMSS